MVTIRFSRLQQVTEWLQWVRAVYSRLPSGYSGLQQITAGYNRLQRVTAWLQWVTVWMQNSDFCTSIQVSKGTRPHLSFCT